MLIEPWHGTYDDSDELPIVGSAALLLGTTGVLLGCGVVALVLTAVDALVRRHRR